MRWKAVNYFFSPHSPQSPHFLRKFTAFTAFLTKIYPKTSTRVKKFENEIAIVWINSRRCITYTTLEIILLSFLPLLSCHSSYWNSVEKSVAEKDRMSTKQSSDFCNIHWKVTSFLAGYIFNNCYQRVCWIKIISAQYVGIKHKSSNNCDCQKVVE